MTAKLDIVAIRVCKSDARDLFLTDVIKTKVDAKSAVWSYHPRPTRYLMNDFPTHSHTYIESENN